MKVDRFGNINFEGFSGTVTNQNRGIFWSAYDKETVTDFSDVAYIRHTINVGGLSGSVLDIKSYNDTTDGIRFDITAIDNLKVTVGASNYTLLHTGNYLNYPPTKIYSVIADNDFIRIMGRSDGSNAGYLEIATADDGDEEIYVRQYSGAINADGTGGTVSNSLTLLGSDGNTSIPNNLGIGYNDTTNIPNEGYRLDVDGSVKIRSDLVVDGSIFADITAGDLSLTGELNFVNENNKYVDFYTNTNQTAHLRLVSGNDFHYAVTMTRGGSVNLSYNNSVKLYTTNDGVVVNGLFNSFPFLSDANNTYVRANTAVYIQNGNGTGTMASFNISTNPNVNLSSTGITGTLSVSSNIGCGANITASSLRAYSTNSDITIGSDGSNANIEMKGGRYQYIDLGSGNGGDWSGRIIQDYSSMLIQAEDRLELRPNGNLFIYGTDTGETERRILYVTDNNRVKKVNITSSRKYKSNIANLTSESFNKIYDLVPVSFNYNEDCIEGADLSKKLRLGFIAEDVAEFMPEVVAFGYHADDYITDPNDPDGVKIINPYAVETPQLIRYDSVFTCAIGALQELRNRVLLLEEEIKNLKEGGA